MMGYKEYLILTDAPAAYVPEDYRAVVLQGEHTDGRSKVMITHTENPLLAGDTLVYGFNPYTGEKVEPLDEALYLEIRPLGNRADGSATGYLGYHSWAGAELRMCGDESSIDPIARLYPTDDLPLQIDIRHKLFDNPAAPAADGWGFRAEIVGDAASRDPSVRSVGAYDDPGYANVLWPTTGGFIRGLSDWQIDENGDPIEIWYTDSWDGHRLTEKRDWYVVLLWASVQEGRATLPAAQDSVVYQFWDRTQGQEPGGEILPWVQPQGAHDAYQIGDQVTYNGSTWESTAANNVWAPGVYGWVVIT